MIIIIRNAFKLNKVKKKIKQKTVKTNYDIAQQKNCAEYKRLSSQHKSQWCNITNCQVCLLIDKNVYSRAL